jgi:hypothetical protein
MKSDDGWKRSAETRATMSASANLRWARPESAEDRAKISAMMKARWADPQTRAETRARMAAARKPHWDKVGADFSPKEVEFRLRRMEVRRAWFARNPQQLQAKRERARKRRERKRQLAANG